MNKIKLDNRLQSVASLVRKGSTVADIGTDHAYVLAYLIENGVIDKAVAADINEGPLKNAEKTLEQFGFLNKTEIILSDGLQNIPRESCNEIIIAGMGGILISEILQKAPWVKDKNIHIIAQPMTHAEILRKWLCKNGFAIDKEVASTDGKRVYVAISAYYNGFIEEQSEAFYYIGKLAHNECELSHRYLNNVLESLKKKHTAQKNAGVIDADGLENIILEMNALIGRKE